MPGTSRGVRHVSSGSAKGRVLARVFRSGLLGGSSAGFRRRFSPWEFGSLRRLWSSGPRHPVLWFGRLGASGSSGVSDFGCDRSGRRFPIPGVHEFWT